MKKYLNVFLEVSAVLVPIIGMILCWFIYSSIQFPESERIGYMNIVPFVEIIKYALSRVLLPIGLLVCLWLELVQVEKSVIKCLKI